MGPSCARYWSTHCGTLSSQPRATSASAAMGPWLGAPPGSSGPVWRRRSRASSRALFIVHLLARVSGGAGPACALLMVHLCLSPVVGRRREHDPAHALTLY